MLRNVIYKYKYFLFRMSSYLQICIEPLFSQKQASHSILFECVWTRISQYSPRYSHQRITKLQRRKLRLDTNRQALYRLKINQTRLPMSWFSIVTTICNCMSKILNILSERKQYILNVILTLVCTVVQTEVWTRSRLLLWLYLVQYEAEVFARCAGSDQKP